MNWHNPDTAGNGKLPQTIVSPIDGAEMVFIPEGTFTMGITEAELYKIFALDQKQNPIFATEIPARELYLKSYYIDRYPVTNYQYRKFIEATGHRNPLLINESGWGGPMQPVVFVGWDDARTYANWSGKSLPSEAQWEKAARGTDRRWWAWGNTFKENRCNSREFGLNRTSDIGMFDEGMSPYGCYDMSGNVWEMCEGQWLESYRPMRGGPAAGRPTIPSTVPTGSVFVALKRFKKH